VKPVRLQWLWRNRILAGKLNVFSGEPDTGKGMTTVDLAARITKHLDFPDCKNELPGRMDVLFLCSEDDVSDTVIPRLKVAGADMTRVHFAQITENVSGTQQEGLVCLDRDISALEAMIKENPGIVLVVIDPVIAFLGDADPNKDKDVRPIYSRLKITAEQTGVALLFVNHWNKNQHASSINRTSGAKTMVSAPRIAWMFSKDPKEPGRYLMMRGKGNLARSDIKTLAYKIVSVPFDFGDGRPPDPDGVPRLEWQGETDETCDQVLLDAADTTGRQEKKAETFLKDKLVNGAMLAAEVYDAGRKEKISADKLKRARYALNYPVKKIKEHWFWGKNEEDLKAVSDRLSKGGMNVF
jgi:putative DNA primase/helicase